MQYLGGKEKVARDLTRVLRVLAIGHTRYLEPFMGGASIASRMAPLFPGNAVLADGDPDVPAMWTAAVRGYDFPDEVSREDYLAAKELPPGHPLRGFVSFGCSFGGKKWGGWIPNRARGGGPLMAKRTMAKKAEGLHEAHIIWGDYRDHEVDESMLVYCDPPYQGTTGYGVPFDHDVFWETMRDWSLTGATVVVSEYAAPPEWVPVWRKVRPNNLGHTRTIRTTEKLFMLNREEVMPDATP